jgi:glycosyltransferase involved in cell wall biosynthesis
MKTMSKRILYISYDGMTDPLGQSQVLPYLASLATVGYDFTIISFEKKNRFEKDKAIIEKIVKESGIKWIPLLFSKNPPYLSKVYDRWKLKQVVKKLFRQQHFDMVHCRSYVAAEIGLWAKKKYLAKFLFDMRGFWADEKIDSGQWKLSNPLYRLAYNHYKKNEKNFLLNADAVISLTNAAKNELNGKNDYSNVQIDVIPCCADLDHFNYHHINKEFAVGLREQMGIRYDEKVITYLGSVGGWYMTKEMFSFLKELLNIHPEFTMLVLTKDDSDHVKAEAAQYGIPANKVIVRYAGRNELPDYLSLSDCSIFFIRPTYSKMASSPTKHAELMGMGIPVICNNIGDTGFVIEDTQTGIVINKFETEEYQKTIQQLTRLLSIDKEKIRQGAFKYFDLEKGAGMYLQIYKRLLKD